MACRFFHHNRIVVNLGASKAWKLILIRISTAPQTQILISN